MLRSTCHIHRDCRSASRSISLVVRRRAAAEGEAPSVRRGMRPRSRAQKAIPIQPSSHDFRGRPDPPPSSNETTPSTAQSHSQHGALAERFTLGKAVPLGIGSGGMDPCSSRIANVLADSRFRPEAKARPTTQARGCRIGSKAHCVSQRPFESRRAGSAASGRRLSPRRAKINMTNLERRSDASAQERLKTHDSDVRIAWLANPVSARTLQRPRGHLPSGRPHRSRPRSAVIVARAQSWGGEK